MLPSRVSRTYYDKAQPLKITSAIHGRIAAGGGGGLVWFRGLTPQQQPGSYQGGEMMMKSVFWWRKPEHPEETTDLRQVTDETLSHIRPRPSPGIELGPQRCEAK